MSKRKTTFESILYDTENKEVVIILGYGIGNHLSLKFLRGIAKDVAAVFPMSEKEMEEMPFNPVSDSSRRHKYMWYARIANRDLTHVWKEQGGKCGDFKFNEHLVFAITPHKKGVDGWVGGDEDTKTIMNRLIHG